MSSCQSKRQTAKGEKYISRKLGETDETTLKVNSHSAAVDENGQYLSQEPSGRIIADRVRLGAWEKNRVVLIKT